MRNQNINNYNSLKARIKSRFMLDGGVFFNSMIILSGSPGSAEGMAERLTTKSEDNERALIDSAKQWEVLKDKIKYSGKTFKVFAGDDSNEPRIIDNESELVIYHNICKDRPELLLDVPIEYRKDFEDDILIAIRDIAGSVTRSTHSYITNVEKLKNTFSLKSRFFNVDTIKLPFFDNSKISDFLIDSKTKLIKDRLINHDKYRFIHIDIGVVSDLTGISMTHIADFIDTKTFDPLTKKYHVSKDAWYINDFNIGISRLKNEETSIKKVLDFIIYLRDHGVNIYKVTIDGYQSTQLKQELITHGISAEIMSVTRSSTPFDVAKRAIYSDRLQATKNETTQKEFLQFKKVIKSNGKLKIYHPGSSFSGTSSHGDIAESLVGSIYSAYINYKTGIDPLRGFNFNESLANIRELTNSEMEEDALSLINGL